MNIKVITISDNDQHAGYLDLKKSLDKFGYNYEHIHAPFAFGTQMKVIYEWCKKNKDNYTHVLYTDAFDTVALAPMEEVLKNAPDDVLFFGSTEKNCYPIVELAVSYPPSESRWRYCNAGNWIADISWFIKVFEDTHKPDSNDQDWLARQFLNALKTDSGRVFIDTECEVFQSIAFESDDEFAVTRNKRVLNRLTNSLPVFIHNNGGQHHVPTWVTDLLK